MPTLGRGPVTGWPSTSTRPPLGARNPAMTRRSVDLPQPEGPTMATSSPRPTARSMSRSASTGPDVVA